MEAKFLDACGVDDLFTVISLLTSSPGLTKWKDPTNGTAGLIIAAQSDSLGVLQHLLSLQGVNAPDVNARDSNGGTALLSALESKQTRAALMLLADSRVDSAIESNSGMTPIMLACKLDAREVVAKLLERVGRDHVAGAKDGPGQTARNAGSDIISLPEQLRESPRTASDVVPAIWTELAASRDDGRLPVLFSGKLPPPSSLPVSAAAPKAALTAEAQAQLLKKFQQRDVNALIQLLEGIEDPSPLLISGDPLLHFVIQSDNVAALRLLLGDKRMDFNVVDRKDRTALFLAADQDHPAMVEMMLRRPDMVNAEQPVKWGLFTRKPADVAGKQTKRLFKELVPQKDAILRELQVRKEMEKTKETKTISEKEEMAMAVEKERKLAEALEATARLQLEKSAWAARAPKREDYGSGSSRDHVSLTEGVLGTFFGR